MSADELDPTGRRLVALEEGIGEDLHAAAERLFAAGQKLAEIRDGRLYLQGHESFEVYCRDRWGFTARRAYQLVQAGEVRTMVPIENERQGRALAPLIEQPEAIEEVWGQVLDEHGEHPTGSQLAAAVDRRHDEDLRRDLQRLGAPPPVPAAEEAPAKLSPVERKAWREVRRRLEVALRIIESLDPRFNPYTRADMADEVRRSCTDSAEVLRDLAVAQRQWSRETTPDRSG